MNTRRLPAAAAACLAVIALMAAGGSGMAAAVPAVFAAAGIARHIRHKKRGDRTAGIGCLVLSFLSFAMLCVCVTQDVERPVPAEGEKVTVTGTVINVTGSTWSNRLWLTDGVLAVVPAEESSAVIGSRVEVTGKVRAFSTADNPGQFDAASYYERMGCRYELRAERVRVLPPEGVPGRVRWLAGRVREAGTAVIRRYAGEQAGVLAAVLFGDRSGVDEDVAAVLREGGLFHLIAVSGLHFSLFCRGLLRLLRRAGAPKRTACGLSMAACLFYLLMTGCGLSGQRASLQFALQVTALLVGRTYDPLSAVSFAFLVQAFHRPAQVLLPGFQLSYTAALVLAVCEEVFHGWDAARARAASAGALWLASAPILAWHYGTVPVGSLLLNPVFLPLMPLIMGTAAAGCAWGALARLTGLAGQATSLPAQALFVPGRLAVLAWEKSAALTSRLPGGVLVTGRPAPWQIFLYLALPAAAGVLWHRWKHGQRHGRASARIRRRAWLLLLPLLLLPFALVRVRPRALTVTMLAVGQGECLLTRTPDGEVLMTDCGTTGYDGLWENIVHPYLSYEGIGHIDACFLTHGDTDHCSGLLEMLHQGFPVEVLYLSTAAEGDHIAQVVRAAEANGTEVRTLAAGDQLAGNGWQIRVIWPEREAAGLESNASSLVYRLQAGAFSMLFTGDTGTEEEERWLEAGLEPAFCLKAGHHGSRFSTSEELIMALQPRIAVISCGRDNLFGHPSPEMTGRLDAAGVDWYCTAHDGAITLRDEGGNCVIDTFR